MPLSIGTTCVRNRYLLHLPLILALVLGLATSPPGYSQTIKVSSSTGFINAWNALKAGDTLWLEPGEYRLPRMETAQAGKARQPIQVRTSKGHHAVIYADQPETFVIRHPYWHFVGLKIQGNRHTEHAFHLSGDADHVLLQDLLLQDFHSHIKSNGRQGGFPDQLRIQFNRLNNTQPRNTTAAATPIDIIGGTGHQVRGNRITHFGAADAKAINYGIFLKGNSRTGLIEQNFVHCSTTDRAGTRIGISLGGGGTAPQFCERQDCSIEHHNGTVRNNIIVGCSGPGIYLKRADSSQILHNTVIDSLGIELIDSSAAVVGNYIDGGITLNQRSTLSHSAHNFSSAGPLAKLGWLLDKLGHSGWSNAFAEHHWGRNRRHGLEFFYAPLSGDMTPRDPLLLRFGPSPTITTYDFSNHERHATTQWMGAIDYQVSPCHIDSQSAAVPHGLNSCLPSMGADNDD